jgi:hypothetical protein
MTVEEPDPLIIRSEPQHYISLGRDIYSVFPYRVDDVVGTTFGMFVGEGVIGSASRE